METTDGVGYRCLCCRDSGLIPADLVRCYLDEYYGLLHPDTGELLPQIDSLQLTSISEVPFRCNACTACLTYVETDTGRKQVPRWADEALDLTVSKDNCQYIHKREWDKWQATADLERQAQETLAEIHQETAARLAALNAKPDVAPQKEFSRLAEALGLPLPASVPTPVATVVEVVPTPVAEKVPVKEPEFVPDFMADFDPVPVTPKRDTPKVPVGAGGKRVDEARAIAEAPF